MFHCYHFNQLHGPLLAPALYVPTDIVAFYFIIVFLGIFLVGFTFFRLVNKNTVELHLFDIVMLLLFFVVAVCMNVHNEVLSNAAGMMMIYFIVRQLPAEYIDSWLLPAILLFFVYEIWLGFKDVYYNYNEPDLFLRVNGSLKNSGIYSIYLIVHLPALYYYLNKTGAGKWGKVLVMSSVLVMAGYLLSVTQSRTSIICLAAFIGIFLFRGRIPLKNKTVIIVISLLLFILLCFIVQWLINIRPGSVSGRYLIWAITFNNISDHVWFGVGYGNFYRHYPGWQIQYFDQLPVERIAEGLHADETYVAFNEPLQFLAEMGMVGTGMGFLFLKPFFNRMKNNPDFWLRITLLAMIITGFSSYTFHVTTILFLFALLLAYLSPSAFKKKIPLASGWFSVIIVTGTLLLVTKSLTITGKVAAWYTIQNDPSISVNQCLQSFNDLYPYLKSNGKFLLDYGENLYLSRQPNAVKILEESKK